MNATEPTKPKVEKVGVLLVHGIGEQCQFEHLESEVRNIAMALRKSAAKINERRFEMALLKLAEQADESNLQKAFKAAAQKISEGNIETSLQELINKINEKNFKEALKALAQKIDEKNIATALSELINKTNDQNLKEALKALAQKIDEGNIATILEKLANKTNDQNLKEELKALAQKIDEGNIATILEKLANKTNDQNLKEELKALAQKTNEGNIATILDKLTDKTNDQNLKEELKALAQKIDEGNIATALRDLVAKTPDLTKFELAELAAKKFAGKARVVQVTINSFPSAAFGAKQETWQQGGRAPVMVEVYDYNHANHTKERVVQIIKIYFHQVWWADLDEPTTLWTEIRFWLWGLSLWTIKGKFKSYLPGSKRMKYPNNVRANRPTICFWARVRLFWVSLVILLILPVLSLLNFVLRGLLAFNIPRPDILSQFVGDVKLLQQEKRIGKGPLQDLSSPPRVTLRRRMIRELVEMALRPYDRWYILAHSQGTVLAFNGIMETAQSLPNYLTKDTWRRCIAKGLIAKAQNPDEELTDEEKETMQPSFPSWRNKEYILDRRKLFKNLRGLLTYGSPLSKFAELWPAIVLLNKDSDVFYKDIQEPQKNFQWLNVYDPTDPVAGTTKFFKPDKNSPEFIEQEGNIYKSAKPIDIPYKANLFHLLSHIEYLTFGKGKKPPLVDLIADWLLEGNLTVNEVNLTVSTKNKLSVERGKPGWPKLNLIKFYQVLRVATWVFAAFLIGSLLSVLISAVPQLSSYFQPITSFVLNLMSPWLQLSVMPLWLKLIITAFLGGISYILLAAIVVLFIGILVKLFVRNLAKL